MGTPILSAILLCVLSLAHQCLGGVHEVWWDITYVEGVNPDGLFARRAIGVNGSWPPPPIEVSTTDSLLVHAKNSLDVPTALHHHGMFFNSTSWMDGALGVTECGIPPGESFDYVVSVDTSGQWGTYWIHSHASGQYVDGLRAPLILHNPREVHKYDEDFTVTLGDWYHDEHPVLRDQFMSIANPGGPEPVPKSSLLYFSQNGTYFGPKTGTSTSGSSVGFNENATIPFEVGKTYRLRIINTSALAAFFFWIDGHDMMIIEVDGTDVEEYPTDLVNIAVAQRYSVLVTARNDTSSNWAIHANMDTDMFDDVPPELQLSQSGIATRPILLRLTPVDFLDVTSTVVYSSSASLTDSGTIEEYHDVDELALVPIEVVAQPQVNKPSIGSHIRHHG
ncbi:hypothetical protein NMY22_g15747 [Coprinellus aureogranulatus]|nr:hypothetical protein NMY22_g15747 [Coprinellus aureogranulatus]